MTSSLSSKRIFGNYLIITVLMLHGLCQRIPEYALFPSGRTCILPVEDFAQLVEWCARNFDILRPSEIDECLNGRLRVRRPIVLTFDDGLASVIDLALPVLREHHVCAGVFVNTDWTDSQRTPPIFALERTVWEAVPTRLTIRVNDKQLELQVGSRAQISEVFSRVWWFLFGVSFPPSQLTSENVLLDGRTWAEQDIPQDRHFWFPASWDELRHAASEGTLEIGSHMVSHVPLAWLSEKEQYYQLRHSRDQLAQRLGLPITTCSYPHGSYDERTLKLTELIYQLGFTIKPGQLRDRRRRTAAPRYQVPSEAPYQIRGMLRWGPGFTFLARILRRISLT